MSLWQRIRTLLGAKSHAALDRMENPVETLEFAYQKQLDVLQQLKRSIADVLTSEKRLEIEAAQLASAQARAKDTASQALARGDEAGARHALEGAAPARSQIERVNAEIANVRTQREGLETMAAQLQTRLDAMRTQKIALAARYAAAKATTRAGEAVTGLSNDMDEVSRMVERARETALQAQARAQAVSELAASAERPSAAIETSWVDAELNALRGASAPLALGEPD